MRSLGVDLETLVEDFGPHRPVPCSPVPTTRRTTSRGPSRTSARFRRSGPAGRTRPDRPRPGQPAGAGRVHRAGGAAYLPRDPAGGPAQPKRDLLDIVKEVDERVQRVFTDAYLDTAAAFGRVFARLFPGGEGRLVLTDPQNMLTTGIEVEARPPGKKIKRLSCSGRALADRGGPASSRSSRPGRAPSTSSTRSRPALDDTNLGRLITLLAELRDSSQLIVITHQKRTMEIADALYGVTMRGDGVTTVVSQRLREAGAEEPEATAEPVGSTAGHEDVKIPERAG